MKKAIAIFLVLISIITVFTSCDEEKSNDLYFPVTENFGTIDPQVASVSSSKMIAYNCFEGLVRLDENKNIVAAGADSWTVSDDSLTYTFYLRKDAKWYLTNTSKEAFSGDEKTANLLPQNFDTRVTAYDYAFGLKRALDPATGSADGKYLSAIKNAAAVLEGLMPVNESGIQVIDDYTLKITLDYADPNFLYYLTRLAAMPCNETFFNACKGRYGLAMEYMLCNGVYMVYRWTQESVIRLEKNPLYTGNEPAKNDRVWVYIVEDPSTVPAKIEKGTYDAGYVSADSVSLFADGFKVTPLSDVIWGYWFNSKTDIFAYTSFRKAFAAAVDLSLLNFPDYIEGKTGRLLTNTLTPHYEFTPDLIKYDEDAANAYYKNALKEAEDISSSVTVTVLTTPDFEECVKKQIQIWQRVFGIDVKIDVQPREDAQKLLYSDKYQVAFLPVSVTASNTAEFFRTFKSDSSYNVTGYTNENYDNLINSLTDTMSDEQKNNIFKKCEQTVISDGAVIPVCTEASYFILGKNAEGIYSFSNSEIYFRNGYVI